MRKSLIAQGPEDLDSTIMPNGRLSNSNKLFKIIDANQSSLNDHTPDKLLSELCAGAFIV